MDRLQLEIGRATEFDSATYAKFVSFIQLISHLSLPSGSISEDPAAVDVYFKEGAYAFWNAAQQAACQATQLCGRRLMQRVSLRTGPTRSVWALRRSLLRFP